MSEQTHGTEHEWVIDPARVHEHVGHDIEIATYGPKDAPVNLAIECATCYEVLGDIDIFDVADNACQECGHPGEQHDCCPLRCAGCGDAFVYHAYVARGDA